MTVKRHTAITRRELFAELCNERKITRAVEIGTERGVFARRFMQGWKIGDILVCVDPWEPYPHMPYDRTPDMMMTFHALAPWCEKVKIIRATSEHAARCLGSYHSPGFVYIDGAHDYDNVALDIKTWWPLVYRGGILAGHDYVDAAQGVKRAVNEFAEAHNFNIWLTSDDNAATSWWIDKP